MNFNEFNKLPGIERYELYDNFVCDWQDEYGPRPDEYVPDMDSMDFEDWLLSNC